MNMEGGEAEKRKLNEARLQAIRQHEAARRWDLMMLLMVKAAKGDKEGVFRIARRLVEEFEKMYEEEEKIASQS